MNPVRLFVCLLFYFSQNEYFGWHAGPHSDAELIVDGITLLLFSLALKPSRD